MVLASSVSLTSVYDYRKLGNKPSLLNLFLGNPVFGEVYLERIPFDQIAQDGKESADWLLANFQERVTPNQQLILSFKTLCGTTLGQTDGLLQRNGSL